MKALRSIGIGTVALIGGASVFGMISYRSAIRDAQKSYAHIATDTGAARDRFDPEHVRHLPEIAQRYLRHAIAPGTPLYATAELEMEGTFLLGDKQSNQAYSMSARQAIRPPDGFVWIPHMRSGAMTISGSDGLIDGEAWTRFWLLGLLPVALERSSPDLVRSAQFRAAVEGALWLPTTLLPERGADWEQIGPDEAQVTIRRFEPAIVVRLKLDQAGAVTEIVGQRWSNANADERFRLQPFGGTVMAESTIQGLTIPTQIAVGNHYGTADYLPFFQARITRAVFR
jgi:hypothetical protein